MKAHLGAHACERLGQEVRRTHPVLDRSERVLRGLATHTPDLPSRPRYRLNSERGQRPGTTGRGTGLAVLRPAELIAQKLPLESLRSPVEGAQAEPS